jgi:hypothetical protein
MAWANYVYDNKGPWGHTVAHYDFEFNMAAKIIQAVFRGWQVRMKYRYNPHCGLGRHIILREAGFATEA